jgi:Fe-S-cluster containining protein
MIENQSQTGGAPLEPGQRFCFACRPELACFNTCCRDKRLPLWPYDVLRLCRALEAPSSQILEQYAELEMDPVSGWPALRLRLDSQGRCPFVSPAGCAVYAHRPAACRIYPLARLARPGTAGGPPEVVYMRQETKGCLGWDQSVEHDLADWDADQELAEYHHYNDALLPLLFHPKRKGRLNLNPRQLHAVILALYNPEMLRASLSQPVLRDKFDSHRLNTAQQNAEELLLLGRDFLIEQLFG